MTEEHEDHDVELVATVTADPLKVAFCSAIQALMEALGDCPAREIAVREVMAAHDRAHERLIRKIMH